MKIQSVILPLLYAAFAATFTLSCSEEHDHAHGEDPEHEHGDKDEGKGHDDDKDHAEGDHEHDHEKLIAGPNGGRVLTSVEPHLEFLVTDDRKVRITAIDDDAKPIALSGQSVSAVTGDRSAPTRLAFRADGKSLLSNAALPAGNDLPIVVSIKNGPDAETVREKFNVNLKDCPTCDYKEYACICEHAHEEGEDDHKHEDKKN